MVLEGPFRHGDPYDEIEDLSQVEVIPPHEMLTEFKNINVAGKLSSLSNSINLARSHCTRP